MTTTYSTDWDVDQYRDDTEPEEHWELRKAFMETHKGTFSEEYLVALARTFTNIEFMGCSYPAAVMMKIAELSKDVAKKYRESKKNKLQRTFVSASNAAENKISGENHLVQIDESVITKRKYNRGRLVKESWILGIYDVTEKRGFIKYVENRTTATLLPVIRKHVRVGSEIRTDNWRAYSTLKDHGFIHKTVNHSRNFKDPITGVCTNQVEGFWSGLKRYLRAMGVMHSRYLPQYIDQFMWKQIYGKNATQRMYNLTAQIGERY